MATEVTMLRTTFAVTFLDHAAVKWMIGLGIGIGSFLFPSEAIARCAWGVFGLICLDWFTGVTATLVTGRKFSSRKARKGAVRMLGYMIQIVLVGVAAATLPELKGAHTVMLGILLGHIGWTEVVSITENLARMGTPMPEPLLDAIKAYRAKKDKREKDAEMTPREETNQ